MARTLGSPALTSDLMNATFVGTHVFDEGEIVLVPRTRGGFTYGKVERLHSKKISCHLDKSVQHQILEYQVIVEEDPEVVVKGLPAAYVGKIRLNDEPYEITDATKERVIGGQPLVKDLKTMIFGSSRVIIYIEYDLR